MAAIRPAISVLATQSWLKFIKKDKTASSFSESSGSDTPKTDTLEKDSKQSGSKDKDTKANNFKEKDLALKDAPVGSISNVKDLYLGPPDFSGKAQWMDKYPEDAEEAAETEETERYALIARKKKCYSGRKKFDIDSIIIHSPALKKVLGRVFNKYPGVTCALDRLVFQAPFQPFIHRWIEFTEAMKVERDVKTKEHLELLHNLLKVELKDTIKALEDCIIHGVTAYEHLWAIFQSGSIVYTKHGGVSAAMSFHSGSYNNGPSGDSFQLSLDDVRWYVISISTFLSHYKQFQMPPKFLRF